MPSPIGSLQQRAFSCRPAAQRLSQRHQQLQCRRPPVRWHAHAVCSTKQDPAVSQEQGGLSALHACAAAAVAAAFLVTGGCEPADASIMLPPLMYDNPAVLKGLRTLKQPEKLFGAEAPGEALIGRFKQASTQLQRFETLVRIGQYDSARFQLRKGAFKQLRMDLGYGQEAYSLITPQMVRQAVEGVEQLDGALKMQLPYDDIRPIITSLQQQLDQLVTAVEPLQDMS